jgi:hypothetical protein
MEILLERVGSLVAFALDQPQAQPLKVARRQSVEGQGVDCAGDRRLRLGQGLSPIWTGRERAGIPRQVRYVARGRSALGDVSY